MGGRHIQSDAGVHGPIPKQGASGQICDQDVPPQHLSGRAHLPRHSPSAVDSDLRRRRDIDFDPVPAERPQPELTGQRGSSTIVPRKQARVQSARHRDGGVDIRRR